MVKTSMKPQLQRKQGLWAVHAQSGLWANKPLTSTGQKGSDEVSSWIVNCIARAGQAILHPDSLEPIGEITSGCPSFSTEQSIAVGYINAEYTQSINRCLIDIRGKHIAAKRSKMPFYQLPEQHA